MNFEGNITSLTEIRMGSQRRINRGFLRILKRRPAPHTLRTERERTSHPPRIEDRVRGWPTQRDVRGVGKWKDS